MALKRVNTDVMMDSSMTQWMEQVQYIPTALIQTIKHLSGEIVTIKSLAVKAVDTSGRSTWIKNMIIVPEGLNEDATFRRGSNVAQALISFLFKTTFDQKIETISGQPSAVMSIDFSLVRGIEVGAPGLVISAPSPSPIVPLTFILISSFEGADIYNVVNTADIQANGIARINYIQTPHIFNLDAGGTVYRNFNQVLPAGGTTTLKGTWNYVSTETLSDEAVIPTLSTFVSTIKTNTNPPTHSITKNGIVVANSLDAEGFYVSTTSFSRQTNLILPKDPFQGVLDLGVGFRDSINDGSYFGGYRERASSTPLFYKSIKGISSYIEVTNNTTATFLKGTVLGRYQLDRNPILDIF